MGLEKIKNILRSEQKVLFYVQNMNNSSLVQMEKVLLSAYLSKFTEDSLIYIQTFVRKLLKTSDMFFTAHLFLLKAKYVLYLDKNILEAESFSMKRRFLVQNC